GRVIREILHELHPHTKYRVASDDVRLYERNDVQGAMCDHPALCLEILFEGEAYLVEIFTNSNTCAHNKGRVTVKKSDIQVERKL
ncbi:hypothetical protein GCK32_000801, partial [Trichostrongylus colubriformis]